MSNIEVERSESGVATVWLNNPKHLNALSNEMVFGLCAEMPKLAEDKTCRAIILRGREGVFCAGRELSDLKKLQGQDLDAARTMYGYMRKMNEVISYAPQPVIGLVERYALGIGTAIVSWTDIAIAEESTIFGYPEVHHGITPYGAVPTMLKAMGQKATMDLLLTGRKIDAHEAVRLGIITRAVPAAQLTAELDHVLANLFKSNPAALAKSKLFARECETLTYQQAIELAADRHALGIGMPETRQGVSAFLDKGKSGGY